MVPLWTEVRYLKCRRTQSVRLVEDEGGVLDKTASGAIEFPYEAVKVEFLLQAA